MELESVTSWRRVLILFGKLSSRTVSGSTHATYPLFRSPMESGICCDILVNSAMSARVALNLLERDRNGRIFQREFRVALHLDTIDLAIVPIVVDMPLSNRPTREY